MVCSTWYYLYNLENVKNTHVGVLLLYKRFSRFLNCTNGNKSRNASHIEKSTVIADMKVL